LCELLGMSFNLPVRPSISFRGFRHRGKYNPDGWGIAFYPDECASAAQVIKEPIEAKESKLSKFLKDYEKVKSKIFVAHVRRASVGEKGRYKNTHPFCRELNEVEYVFAHNGTLNKTFKKTLELVRFKPIGETDSEHAFCYLLKCIEERGIAQWKKNDFDWLTEKLREINKYGTFNCIFSDGKHLFCYYDENGYNGLCFVQRKPPYSKIQLLDEDWEINLAEEKRPEQTGYIVATRRLTDEQWQDFKFGELIVFKGGKMIYSNCRDVSNLLLEEPLTCKEKEILRILRGSPHRLSLREIIENSKYSADEIKSAVHSLLCKGYIRQDRRDEVGWNHDKARFFTEPEKRKEIDAEIK